jgi:hypothetical protein
MVSMIDALLLGSVSSQILLFSYFVLYFCEAMKTWLLLAIQIGEKLELHYY